MRRFRRKLLIVLTLLLIIGGVSAVTYLIRWKLQARQRGPAVPTARQLAAAERMTRSLLKKYGLTADDVFLHHELVITHCPGSRFPREAFMRAIRGE